MSHTVPANTPALPHSNRRAVLGAIAATALLGVPASSFATNSDERLFELGRRWAAANKQTEQVQQQLDLAAEQYVSVKEREAEGSAMLDEARRAWRKAEHACEPLNRLCAELRYKIARCPAVTMLGLMLKVGVASGCLGLTPDDIDVALEDHIDDGSVESLALSIVRDLRQMDKRSTSDLL